VIVPIVCVGWIAQMWWLTPGLVGMNEYEQPPLKIGDAIRSGERPWDTTLCGTPLS
jgi:hypothetical protein